MIKGSFLHITGPHLQDADEGGLYKFDLKINLGNDRVRSPGGDQNWELIPHPAKEAPFDDHLDAYASLLKGTARRPHLQDLPVQRERGAHHRSFLQGNLPRAGAWHLGPGGRWVGRGGLALRAPPGQVDDMTCLVAG